MKFFSEFEAYINQISQESINIKNNDSEINIGTLTNHFLYINNNPLEFRVFKRNSTFTLKSDSKLNVQYIRRLKNTPFYISLLTFDDFHLKILDFYDWRNTTKFFRIFILKKTNIKKSISNKLVFSFDVSIRSLLNNAIKLSNSKISLSEHFSIKKNQIEIDLQNVNDSGIFYLVLEVVEENDINYNQQLLIKTFYQLENICIKNHIKNYFITKNKNEESSLDRLWTNQKFILPDLQADSEIFISNIFKNLHLNWIKLFYQYLSLNNQSVFDESISNKIKFNSSDLHVSLSNSIFKIISDEGDKDNSIERIQKWWNVYSLPVFSIKFYEKCLNQPEEVFSVYFNAIKYSLPWSDVFYKKILSVLKENSTNQLHKFLLLLSHLYQRIYKNEFSEKRFIYSPGFVWDNNFKSIKGEFGATKFSKNNFTNLYIEAIDIFRINKLCVLEFDKNVKNIKILPLSHFNLDARYIDVKIDKYSISLPLIWKSGFMELMNLRIKWILKKDRYQFTIHSKYLKTLSINNEKIDLIPNIKKVFHLEIEKKQPSIYMKIYNNTGGKWISKKFVNQNDLIISGIYQSKEGILSENILYSIDKTKHKLPINSLENQFSKIDCNHKVDTIIFYAKDSIKEIDVPYFSDLFWDNFLNTNAEEIYKYSIIIHKKFRSKINTILQFFQNIFGFQPEFYSKESREQLKQVTSHQIYFEYVTSPGTEPEYEIKNNKLLIIRGDNIQNLLNIFTEKLKEYL